MTTFKGEGYKFPDEQEAATDDFEFEVVDDTPEADRGREPMQEPPEDVTEDDWLLCRRSLPLCAELREKRVLHLHLPPEVLIGNDCQ